ncbi:MAG: acetyltransferase [Pseudomonadota bacterium]|nr:acetyltransferase [Pseudomonadota bacterium]
MRKLYIFGTGVYSEVAYRSISENSDISIEGFISSYHEVGRLFLDKPVIPLNSFINDLAAEQEVSVFVAVANSKQNSIREKYFNLFRDKNFDLFSYIDPTVRIDRSVRIGEHVCILNGCNIGPETVIGDNVIMWSGATVGHHCRIGNNVFMAGPSCLGGRSSLGDNSFVGLGAIIRDGIVVGKNNLIGAGSLIMKSTKEGQIYHEKGTAASKVSVSELYGIDE